MKVECVLSTTYVDKHNMRMSKEALESAACQINADRKPRLGLDHDMTLPPLGKILSARVEPLPDGEFQLVGVQEVFEEPTQIELPDGVAALMQKSQHHVGPFICKERASSGALEVACDLVNFDSRSELREFLAEVRASSDLEIKDTFLMRKSVIPDPELVFTLTMAMAKSFAFFHLTKPFGQKVAEALADSAAADVKKIYATIREGIIRFAKFAKPFNRPKTYIVVLPGTPNIELIARTTDPRRIVAALDGAGLEGVHKYSERLRATHSAEVVQFIWNETSDKWELNYLLTEKGESIGTIASFDRRDTVLSAMHANSSPKAKA